MKNIEDMLNKEKERMDSIKAPDELEDRLRKALNVEKKRKTYKSLPLITAAALLFILFVGYNYNALAYYGKKLLGFDEIMNGTLNELNEQGMGQVIGETEVFSDGSRFTIDGIISDSNRMILYYTVKNNNGLLDESFDHFKLDKVTGLMTDSYAYAGTGILSEDGTEFKGSMEFEPVNPFAKKLNLHYTYVTTNDVYISDKMEIPYDPNKALQTEIKQNINETVQVDKGSITFTSITASPTMTLIEGKVNVENFDRSYSSSSFDRIELVANGQKLDQLGSGSTTALTGRTFDIRYDALPKDIQSLQIVIHDFISYLNLDHTIDLEAVNDNELIDLSGEDLWIQGVKVEKNKVEIKIMTELDTMLDGEGIFIHTTSEDVPLLTTTSHNNVVMDGTEWLERTLVFETNEEPISLYIKGLHYMKPYNVTIDIPIN